ncbi:MAG: alpha/beta fold hydrolase [Solirubrobacterales bacterium]|nr:alpha/beta fold hydrolase [Solirubrobacterales bacterium]
MLGAPAEVALSALDMARSGRFADILELFAAPLRPLITSEALETGWNAELGRQGPIVSVGAPLTEPTPTGVVVVKVPVTCERGGFALVAPVTEQGQLAGLQLAPLAAAEPIAPWEPPGYADPASFDEHEVTLGSGALAVEGILTVPHRAGPLPAVVLLAGSGSLDRDETIGRSKPLKDIGWGLATRGIAVLRFDKVTFAHARELARAERFTVNDEYMPHALAAIELLRGDPVIDGARIFLLGHSLGGTVAPRIAAADPSVAGLVMLAGGAQPLHWVLVRQFRYLASLSPEGEAASRQVIDTLTEQARRIDGPDLSTSTPAAELPLGAPASYWLDLRDYDPAALAATLNKPMLILQGARDYQVTVADDLARWQAALADRADVTIRVYPRLNHLFAPGSGPSSPAEYEPAQHVDPVVVSDIASWVERPAGTV